MSESTALIYARIPAIACKQKCQASCGPIMASERESIDIRKATGKDLPDPLDVIDSPDMSCTLLSPDGKCGIYQHRPLICRLWGVVERMACPFGCVPDRWLSDDEAGEMLAALGERG